MQNAGCILRMNVHGDPRAALVRVGVDRAVRPRPGALSLDNAVHQTPYLIAALSVSKVPGK